VTISPFTALAKAASVGAQAQAQFRLQLIGNQLTAQLNKKIAALKAQADDPVIKVLQQQEQALSARKSTYSASGSQLGTNVAMLSDLKLQLSNLAVAATAGDAGGFDAALTAATGDVDNLKVVAFQPGYQPDGVAQLKGNGLGIQPSANYDLSTPAGQTQASADVQNAQGIIDQISATSLQNQTIAGSIANALSGQITQIQSQITARQNTEIVQAAGKIQTLQQQTQTEFHLIELSFGNIPQLTNIFTAAANANNTAPPPGTVISLIVGQSNGAVLPSANIGVPTPTTRGNAAHASSPSASGDSSASGTGSNLSISA
jgi:hypothetical protein